MSMTEKDFKLIARVLASEEPEPATMKHSAWSVLILKFSKALRSEYSNFDEGKFLIDCEDKEAT